MPVPSSRGRPVALDHGLSERNWGSWECLTGPERDRIEFVGEPPEEHAARVVAALEAIAERHPAGRIVVVTHGGSLRRIQAVAYGVALPAVENCAAWAVAAAEGTFRP